MPEAVEPTYGETPELDYSSGLTKLNELSKAKLAELKRCVIIAIAGLPNSGKTHLIDDFYRQNGHSARIRGLKGPDEADTQSLLQFLRESDFIVFETLSDRFLSSRNLNRMAGQTTDIYIHIYNPNLQDESGSMREEADFIIRNEKAKIKPSPT